MNICGVIPIRFESRRFPGKGLAKLQGKEIVLHVFERARQYRRFSRLLVATDSPEIADLIEKHQGEVFFSDQPFRNGSERVAAAIADIECDICINIQGDEVFITPEVLDRAVQVLERRPELQIATAVFPIDNGTDLADRNLVKVKVDNSGTVTAFSRDPINAGDRENHGHVGIYAYRKPFLLKFARLQPTAGEIEQSLEQLRIIEHGFSIGAAILPQPLMAINSPADLVQAEKLLAGEKGS